MSSEYRFLEVLFSTNCSGQKGSLEKLRNSVNGVSGATLVTGYDNGAKFLLHISQASRVISEINKAGFGIVQNGKFDDGTYLLIINDRADSSFSDLDNSRIAKMWE